MKVQFSIFYAIADKEGHCFTRKKQLQYCLSKNTKVSQIIKLRECAGTTKDFVGE